MQYEVVELPFDEITVENRYREDLGDIDRLVEDIKTRGLLQPITVNQEGKLLAGGRRFIACQKAGMETIPAIIRESKGIVDELEIELVENLHRKDLTWYEDAAITAKIYELTKEHRDEKRKKRKKGKGSQRQTGEICGKSLGQVSSDLKLAGAVSVMPELKKCKSKKEAMNVIDRALHSHEVSESVKKAAEAAGNGEESSVSPYTDIEDSPSQEESDEDKAASLFRRADANYKVGDAIEGMREMAEIFKNSPGGYSPFGLLEIDPPYGVDLHTVKGGSEARKEDYMKEYDEIPKEKYPQFLKDVCEAAYDCCNDSGFVVFWFGWEWFWEVYGALTEAGFIVDHIPAIWVKAADSGKGATGQTNQPKYNLARSHEPFFIARKENSRLAREGRPNCFIYKTTPPSQKYHPTQRPLDLMKDIIQTFCWSGLGVLSPFLGSGITLLACYETGRNGVGFDLSESNKKHFLNMVIQHYGGSQ